MDLTAIHPDAGVGPVSRPPGTGALYWLDRVMLWVVGIPACCAVVAEVVILLTGIVARFVFHAPLVWSDELASILFLWLAMLGSAVAVQRGEHMRLGYVAASMPPSVRPALDALSVAAPTLFVLLILGPAFDYVDDQSFMVTPALGWNGTIRASAMPAGCILILLCSASRLLRSDWRSLLIVAALLAAIAGALTLGAPALLAIGNWNLLVFFVGLLAAGVFAGVPIAFAFGLSTVAYIMATDAAPVSVVVGRMDEGMSSLILLAIPLFVLLGQLMVLTNMAAIIVEFLASLVGHLRGGLCYVLLAAMILVSGISGSKAADMAAVAPVLFPEMRRRGAHEGELISLLVAAGAMSETIPPSIVLITIGSATGVSIAALFTAGMLPGLFLAVLLGVLAWWRSGKQDRGVRQASLGRIGRSLAVALPALLLPILIRTAVVEGVATATEVSTIGIAYAMLVGILVYRRFDWRQVPTMLLQTASLSGAILLIIGAATGMAWSLTQSGFSHALAGTMKLAAGGPFGFLLISTVVFTVLGSVLEGIPAIVLFGPLLFPIARDLGVNEVHYAIVVVLAMGLGLFSPPFGVGYYMACLIGRVSPDVAMRRVWSYLAVLAAGLLVVVAVPWISTGFLQ